MKTYIYGAGNIALHIIAKMKECEGEITGFIDSYKKGEYEGYPIVLLEDVEKDSFYFMNSDGGKTAMWSSLCSIRTAYWKYTKN